MSEWSARERTAVALVAVVLGIVVLGALAGCSALDEPAEPTARPDDAVMSAGPGEGLDTISWGEAVDSIGQRLRVEGVVAGVKRRDGYTEVSIGLPPSDPERVAVIVPDKLATRFEAPLRDLFDGMLVRATGTIVESDGVVSVRIARPRDLRLVQ